MSLPISQFIVAIWLLCGLCEIDFLLLCSCLTVSMCLLFWFKLLQNFKIKGLTAQKILLLECLVTIGFIIGCFLGFYEVGI